MVPINRGPNLSMRRELKIHIIPNTTLFREEAREALARVQPNSLNSGSKKTPKAALVPQIIAIMRKELVTTM